MAWCIAVPTPRLCRTPFAMRLGHSLSVFAAFFFFNDTATTEIYTTYDTLSLHDALPISGRLAALHGRSEVERAPVDFPANRRHRLVSSLGAPADERKVAAGGQEPSSRACDAPGAGDSGHLEVVTQNEAGEAETLPEQASDDRGRERRWEGRVEGAVSHVCDHHRRAAGSEGGAKWNEIPALQLVYGRVDVLQREMRVDRGASVSREVLGDGNESFGQHGLDERDAARGDDIRGRPKRAVTDHRVRRIEQAVENRRQPGVEAGGAELARHCPRDSYRQVRIARASNRCRRRKPGEGRGQAVNLSAFVIHEDEDIGAELPRRRREREHGLEAWAVPREQDDAAQSGLLRQRHEIVGNARALEADGQGASGPRRHPQSPRSIILFFRMRAGRAEHARRSEPPRRGGPRPPAPGRGCGRGRRHKRLRAHRSWATR